MTELESRAQELIELPELADSPLPARHVAQAFILQALRTVEAEAYERAAKECEKHIKQWHRVEDDDTWDRAYDYMAKRCAAAIRALTKGTP